MDEQETQILYLPASLLSFNTLDLWNGIGGFIHRIFD